MAITVDQRPSTTISGETSRWNAVRNPVVYRMTTNKYTEDNYRLEVEVYNAANVLLNEAFAFVPNSAGALVVDISSILIANLSALFAGDLTGTTKIFDDTNTYLKFYIKYQEIWDGSAEAQVNDSGNQFFAVLGGNQIPAPYGGNLAEYVSFNDGGPLANWLTEFESLIFWRGYPQLISVIVGDNVGSNAFIKAGADESTPAALSGKVITVDLNQLLASQESVNQVDIELVMSGPVTLSEALPITLRDSCPGQILLIGRNKRGGMLSWMFEMFHEYTFDYGNNIKAVRRILRADNLTLNQWEALQDFIGLGDVYRNNIVELTSSINRTSTRIGQQVFAVDEDGIKTGVIVVPTKNATKTRFVKHSFDIEIEYPEIF